MIFSVCIEGPYYVSSFNKVFHVFLASSQGWLVYDGFGSLPPMSKLSKLFSASFSKKSLDPIQISLVLNGSRIQTLLLFLYPRM
jgi:hypothetical protein